MRKSSLGDARGGPAELGLLSLPSRTIPPVYCYRIEHIVKISFSPSSNKVCPTLADKDVCDGNLEFFLSLAIKKSHSFDWHLETSSLFLAQRQAMAAAFLMSTLATWLLQPT